MVWQINLKETIRGIMPGIFCKSLVVIPLVFFIPLHVHAFSCMDVQGHIVNIPGGGGVSDQQNVYVNLSPELREGQKKPSLASPGST